MKNSILYTISAFAAATACLSSCEGLLEEHPDSYYERSDFFKDESTVQMGITGIYNVLPSIYGDYDMAFAASDDTYYVSGINQDNGRRDIAHYQLSTSNTYVENAWRYSYDGLNRANYMISGIEGMDGYKDSETLQQLVAEAKFLRAFFSFYLVKNWGDVPYKTEYTGTYEQAYGPRVDRQLIYDQIVSDLEDAKILPWADAATSPERATQGAVRALLMRVLLFRAGYSLSMEGSLGRPEDSEREEYFTAVTEEWEAFEQNGYHGFYNGGYEALFRSFSQGVLDSRESIFEVAFYTEDGRTGARGYWGTYNGPLVAAPGISATETDNYMGRANAMYRVIPEWRDFFEFSEDGTGVTDERRDVMVCTYQYNWDSESYSHVIQDNTDRPKQWYPGKWRREWMPLGYKDPNITDVNYCNIRYADVVLMAAEAYNELGVTGKAWELINSVRSRAGATPVTASNFSTLMKAPKVYDLPFIDDSDEQGRIRTALFWERGFELAFEGHRKYDLIRWGILKEALALPEDNNTAANQGEDGFIAKHTFQTGKHELFPIPLDEIQSNRCLNNTNNPNY